MPSYKILIGVNYPPDKRAEIGDVVTDIPSSAVNWLLEQSVIEVVESSGKKKSAPTIEEGEE